MAEETEGQEHGPSATGLGADAAAMAFALSRPGALDPPAAAYLEEQTRLSKHQSKLTELQSQNLIEQNAFELSHLKWRRFTDRARGIGYAIVMLACAMLGAIVCAAVWAAAHDNALVVESFSVPTDFAERGQSGAVVAQHVLDRIAALQSDTVSVRAASSYSHNWGDDLKVQIPDTGVSFGEAYRYLAHWFGHQTRISGEIVHTDKGFAVTARAGTARGRTFAGGDLDALLDKAAEGIFADTQPYLYGVYLTSHGRNAESRVVLSALARSDASPSERAWAYSGLLYGDENDLSAEQWGRAAVALDPNLMLAHNNLSAVAFRLGHSELGYREALAAMRVAENGADQALETHAAGVQKRIITEERDVAVGDYQGGIDESRADLAVDWTSFRGRSIGFLVRDLAAAHDLRAAKALLPSIPSLSAADSSAARRQILTVYLARAQIDAEAQDWPTANRDIDAGVKALDKSRTSLVLLAQLPLAQAKSGDIAGARSLAATLPSDCYPCVEARADIETEARDWKSAEALFAEAARQAPSLPSAYLDWGAMLLHKGDLDGAIAMFENAHKKGPYFADPLEMWGEALIANDRSDLALVKFEEANKYAPNWGRLHLKWGDALWWSGDKAAARKQFAIASGLDLLPLEKAELTRLRAEHG